MKHDPTLYEPKERRYCYIFSAIASIASAGIQASAAEDAAESQAESADKAIALGREGLDFQKEMFDVNRADTDPYRASGTAALGTLNNLFIPGGQGVVQMQSRLNELRARRAVLARAGPQPEQAPVQQAAPVQDMSAGSPAWWDQVRQSPQWDPGGDGGGGAR